MEFDGEWEIVSSPDVDDAYLREEGTPYVRIRQQRNEIRGSYHVGVQSGSIDGRVLTPETATFSFEGMDEMDEARGAGTVTLERDRLIFKLMYHLGDEFTYECERD